MGPLAFATVLGTCGTLVTYIENSIEIEYLKMHLPKKDGGNILQERMGWWELQCANTLGPGKRDVVGDGRGEPGLFGATRRAAGWHLVHENVTKYWYGEEYQTPDIFRSGLGQIEESAVNYSLRFNTQTQISKQKYIPNCNLNLVFEKFNVALFVPLSLAFSYILLILHSILKLAPTSIIFIAVRGNMIAPTNNCKYAGIVSQCLFPPGFLVQRSCRPLFAYTHSFYSPFLSYSFGKRALHLSIGSPRPSAVSQNCSPPPHLRDAHHLTIRSEDIAVGNILLKTHRSHRSRRTKLFSNFWDKSCIFFSFADFQRDVKTRGQAIPDN